MDFAEFLVYCTWETNVLREDRMCELYIAYGEYRIFEKKGFTNDLYKWGRFGWEWFENHVVNEQKVFVFSNTFMILF